METFCFLENKRNIIPVTPLLNFCAQDALIINIWMCYQRSASRSRRFGILLWSQSALFFVMTFYEVMCAPYLKRSNSQIPYHNFLPLINVKFNFLYLNTRNKRQSRIKIPMIRGELKVGPLKCKGTFKEGDSPVCACISSFLKLVNGSNVSIFMKLFFSKHGFQELLYTLNPPHIYLTSAMGLIIL